MIKRFFLQIILGLIIVLPMGYHEAEEPKGNENSPGKFYDDRKYGLKEAEKIIDGLIERGYSIMLGVPTYWRETFNDAISDPKLLELIKKCDIIMPWFVGRYDQNTFGTFQKRIKDDMVWCKGNGVDYTPLAFPGFSWKNMFPGSQPTPRNRGLFFKQQLSSHIANGAEMLYIAMFDEMDEGTAIFKCATEVPVGASPFLALEKELGSDYYLKLTGEAAKNLKQKLNIKE